MDKRIIYCWFPKGKAKPEKVEECINSWKTLMPDWEILEINEDNFDINYNKYVIDAYKSKAWAYVSDVARLWALYNIGGIYLDTDVMMYKSIEEFSKHKCFTGFEQPHYPVTAVMGAEKGTEIIKEMLDVYENKTFELKSNWDEYETNTMIMSDIIGKYIDRDKSEYQETEKIVVYTSEMFCRGNENTGYTQHLMLGSWIGE